MSIISGEGGGSGGSTGTLKLGWRVGLDLDFTTEPAQSFPTDGLYTIGGLTWRKSGSAVEVAAAAIVAGVGLQLQPVQSTTASAANFLHPQMRLMDITQVVPLLTWATPLRVWAKFSATHDQASKRTMVSLRNALPVTWFGMAQWYSGGVNCKSAWANVNSLLAWSSSVTAAPHTTNDWYCVMAPAGIGGNAWAYLSMAEADIFDDQKADIAGMYSAPVGGSTELRTWYQRITDWEIVLSSLRNGAASALTSTFTRLRVDYLAPIAV